MKPYQLIRGFWKILRVPMGAFHFGRLPVFRQQFFLDTVLSLGNLITCIGWIMFHCEFRCKDLIYIIPSTSDEKPSTEAENLLLRRSLYKLLHNALTCYTFCKAFKIFSAIRATAIYDRSLTGKNISSVSH